MKKIFVLLMTCLVMISCGGCGNAQTKEKEVDGNPKTSQMQAICELATMDCYYHNVAKYTEKDVSGAWFWKKNKKFWIEYSGVVTIGIDASKLKMRVEDDTVTISIPEAKVLGAKADPDSLTEDSFYVEKDSAAIVAEDQTAAYKEAEANMAERASNDTTLLADAQQRAQNLLEDYVKNIGEVVGRQYIICWEYPEDREQSSEE